MAERRASRVDEVFRMMADGTWAGLQSHRELAARWKCSVGAVADYATEASGTMRRLLNMTPEQREDARARVLARLEHIERVALAKQSSTGDGGTIDNPDVKGALGAIDLGAKVLGLYAPEKVAVTVEDKRPATPAEEIAEIDALLEQLTARRAELAAQEGRQLQ